MVGTSPRSRIFYSLRHRDFRYLSLGNFCYFSSQYLQLLSVAWLVLHQSEGSVLVTGAVISMRFLPAIVIGPWGGVISDRVNRRLLLIPVQAVMGTAALVLALLVITDRDAVWHSFLYLAISGSGRAFLDTLRLALVANTVPKQDLDNAMAVYAMTWTIPRLFSPVLGGLLIDLVGIEWNFFLEAGIYVVMMLSLIPMKTPYAEESTARSQSVFNNLREGLRYVWSDRLVLQLIFVSLIPSFLLIPFSSLIPVFTVQVLERGPTISGYLIGAMGVGMVGQGFIVATVGFIFKKGKVTLLAAFLACLFVAVVVQLPWLGLTFVAMVLFGVVSSYLWIGSLSIIQGEVPDTMRGRVSSIFSLTFGVVPLGILLTSLFAEATGIRTAFTVSALAGAVVAGWFMLSFQELRRT